MPRFSAERNAQIIQTDTPTELANRGFFGPKVSSRDLNTVASGRCRYCRCTDARACEDGCWWVDAEQTVCSTRTCVERFQSRVRELYATAKKTA